LLLFKYERFESARPLQLEGCVASMTFTIILVVD